MQQSMEKVYLFRKQEFLTRTSKENVKERGQQSTEKCTSSGKKSSKKEKEKEKKGATKYRKSVPPQERSLHKKK